jgi:hypothetical protein
VKIKIPSVKGTFLSRLKSMCEPRPVPDQSLKASSIEACRVVSLSLPFPPENACWLVRLEPSCTLLYSSQPGMLHVAVI